MKPKVSQARPQVICPFSRKKGISPFSSFNSGPIQPIHPRKETMSNEPSPPDPGQPRELNLQKTANQFMAAVQRHFDLLAFNLASRENASETAYNSHIRAAGIMPVPQIHQNFEQMQAHARDLLLRQVLNDALNLSVSCLNNSHLFLALIKEQKASGSKDLSADQQEAARSSQNAFVKLRLEQKFDLLEYRYSVLCPLEDSLVSLAFALKILMSQAGIVKKDQLDDEGLLQIELASATNSIASVPDLQDANIQWVTRSFRETDRLSFSDSDLQNIVLTVGVFARQTFASVAKFARDS